MSNENQENNEQLKISDKQRLQEESKQTSENLLVDTRDKIDQKKNINDKTVAQKAVDQLFPNLMIFDFQPEQAPVKVENKSVDKTNGQTEKNSSADAVIGKPNEAIEFKRGDKSCFLILDEEGKLKQFNDPNGDKIVRREDGCYYRESLIYPNGEKLEDFTVDPATRAVKMTYKVPKDENDNTKGNDFARRTIEPSGTEITSYDCKSIDKFDKSEYSLRTTRDGTTKTVDVEKDGKVLQTLKYEKDEKSGFDKLVRFEGPNGVYELTKTGWQKNGESVNSVKADSNGAVKVIENSSAARYLPNGTKVESDTDNPPKLRTINTTDKTEIKVSTNGVETQTNYDELYQPYSAPTGKRYLDSITVTNDKTTNTVTYDQEGNPQSLNGSRLKKVGDTFVNEQGETVALEFKSESGVLISLKSATDAEKYRCGDNPFEHRTLIQEMPENYEKLLKERLDMCSNFNYFANYFGTMYLIYNNTKDGGAWDDKQYGGQYQRWGNVAWGMYASETEMPYSSSVWYNGAVKVWLNTKSKDSTWGNPMDWRPSDWFYDSNKTYGQNPADAELIRIGYEQREKQKEIESKQKAEAANRREREVYQPVRPTFSPHPTF